MITAAIIVHARTSTTMFVLSQLLFGRIVVFPLFPTVCCLSLLPRPRTIMSTTTTTRLLGSVVSTRSDIFNHNNKSNTTTTTTMSTRTRSSTQQIFFLVDAVEEATNRKTTALKCLDLECTKLIDKKNKDLTMTMMKNDIEDNKKTTIKNKNENKNNDINATINRIDMRRLEIRNTIKSLDALNIQLERIDHKNESKSNLLSSFVTAIEFEFRQIMGSSSSLCSILDKPKESWNIYKNNRKTVNNNNKSDPSFDDDNDDDDDDDDLENTMTRNLLLTRIFTDDIPLLDVRAGVEFAKGAFPNSVNIPILNDEHRHLVGICYKEKGPDAAFDLGKELVTPIKTELVQSWKKYVTENPDGYVYCFRGGSRSNISKTLLKEEAGVDYPLVSGGYKVMRQFLLDELERVQDLPIVMIGGHTASGKTHLLKRILKSNNRYVDLEGIANHRGSSFGELVDPQPTQINFENEVAIEFLKLRQRQQQQQQCQSGSKQGQLQPQQPIFIEEEGNRIGRVTLPSSMYKAMMDRFPVLELETSKEERVRICIQDYVTDMFPLFVEQASSSSSSNIMDMDMDDGGEDPDLSCLALAHNNFRQVHINSLKRIKSRVHNYEEINAQLLKGLDLFQRTGDESGFIDFTGSMLQYYDKMYSYQMSQRKGEVLFRGDSKDIIEWTESEEGRRRLAML